MTDSAEKPNIFDDTLHDDKCFARLICQNEKLSNVDFRGCAFENCSFVGTLFETCRFEDCTFNSCDLSIAKFNNTAFIDVQFDNSKLVGIDWTNTNKLFMKFNFSKCKIDGSTFYRLDLTGIKITDCTAKDADFAEANLSKAKLNSTDFSSTIFEGTNLSKADFSNAKNYNINLTRNYVKKATFTLPEAVSLLNNFDIVVK